MSDDDRKRELAAGSTLAMDELPRESGGDISAGAMLGRFVLKRRLGIGGMGEVFAGEDVDLGRPVAIKVVREDSDHPAYHARLLREAQALARLEHPNVVRVYEVNSDHGRLFVAMELVDGTTLTAWLRQQQRRWQDIIAMFVEVGVGLAAVHQAGLVHRDFKPDNVLIDRDGKPRVADFGLARTTSEDASPMAAPLTRTGAMMGTPGYMAPEQQFGGDVDARADQYSYCVALREALAGRPVDDARWQLVPRAVRDAIGRGLSYDADERFPRMVDLLDALRRGSEERDQRWVAALMILVVLGAVAGVVAYVSSRKGSSESAQVGAGSAAIGSAAAPVPSDAALVAQAHDAPVLVHEVAPDAAVVVVAEVHVDAGVKHPHERVAEAPPVSKRADAGVVAEPGDAGAPSGPQPIMASRPTSKNLPVAKVGDPGHLAVVRTAIRDLGYEGVDIGKLADFEKDAKAELDGGERVAAGIAHVKLGIVARRKGDCPAALEQFEQGKAQLKPNRDGDAADTWLARGAFGTALCQLGSGKAEVAKDTINYAWLHGSRDEVALVMGMIAFERGEKDVAYAQMLVAEQKPNPRVQTAMKLWLDGFGFGLR